MTTRAKRIFLVFALLLLAGILLHFFVGSGGRSSLPKNYTRSGGEPTIWPDYRGVTIPPNIAPLNFLVDSVDDVVAHIVSPCGEHSYGGRKNTVRIDEQEWKSMLAEAKGCSLAVTVYAKKEGEWQAYKSFPIYVAHEEIDPYISYRVLPPTFVGFDELSIRQRNLENFEETVVYDNCMISEGLEGQCINCHSYQNYKTDNMMFHMRLQHPGTMIVSDGELVFVNLKTEEMISAAAYNAWHPTLPIIAFSTDHTMQSFHSRDITKVEVMESASDIVIYDVKRNRVQTVLSDSAELELFPSWSPDGKWLYYCSAHYEYKGEYEDTDELLENYKSLQYNLYRLSFDAGSMSFGEPELVYDAVSKNRSAVQPRVSQDGRYVLFAEGPWGLFHIWHTSAEVQMLDLKTGQLLDTRAVNSPLPESYPSFSSNDRWLLIESRRDDGNYTRTYFAYFDGNGCLHKPFLVPQKNPEYFRHLLRSWSRPEFMKEPVRITPQQFRDKALTEPISVSNK